MTFHRQPILFSFDCYHDKQQNRERKLWLRIKHYPPVPIFLKRPKKTAVIFRQNGRPSPPDVIPRFFQIRKKNAKHFCRELQ